MIVDAHMHIFRAPDWSPPAQKAGASSWARQVRWYDKSMEEGERRLAASTDAAWDPDGSKTIARMDEAGCDISVMMPMDRGLLTNDEGVVPIIEKNQGCYELTQMHPGRLYSFCGVDPRRPNASEILRRGLREWGMKGLKLYPTTGFYPDDEIVYPLYRICVENDVPVLLHQGHSGGRLKSKYGHPMYVDTVAADFPELRLILGHGGRIETWGHEALSVAIYKTNVHIEISLWQHWLSPDELAKKFVWIRDRIGIDRLLFGSDMTNVEVSITLKEWVDTVAMLPEWAKQLGYRLSQDEIDMVLGGNAMRVYKLPARAEG
jgi:predicted TIM-barrel fold metal-dependent hydrolase